jgi:alanyl-tRNA synthetase
MQSDEIRSRFLKFFEARGHKIIPSSSLVPENDSSVLFTTAGMQQFKQYYTNPKSAEKDFKSLNVVTVQKCIRTGDIDEVGDSTHLTFFEMLGNFSFGGYGRKEAIEYAHEFITKEMNLEISYVTFYKGSKNVPRDDESEKIWKEIGIKNIKEEGEDVFWGPTGDSGPCGPTTEIYCKNAEGEDVEIWNIVFNEYFCEGSREKLDKGETTLKKLDILGVDTGMGFERLVSIVQKKKSVYETDLFYNEKTKEERMMIDHLKASVFIICDGVAPSNKDRGYVLRRLIRKALTFEFIYKKISCYDLVSSITKKYKDIYKNLDDKKVNGVIMDEAKDFSFALQNGSKEFSKGTDPFILFTSFGLPLEVITQLAKEKGQTINLEDFNKKIAEHQKLSQTASAGMFKGGLAGTGEIETKYHTATHLLLASIRKVLGGVIVQKGSHINAERMRFDFNYPEKVPADKLKAIEDLVNQKIAEKISVEMKEMPKEEARKIVTTLSFDLSKYGDMVKVYKIGDFSIEFCGGPHVKNTSELGHFKIQKEEAVSAGIRRIKAILL